MTFTKHTLSNGLLVLLKEVRTAPIISHWVWYRVGSRDELPGGTGLSHWVEHMQFKGTEKFPAGVLDRAIAREGGFWNAFTYLDWTTYFETMPAEKIDLCLQLEADRMREGRYTPEDVESERTVIISERQGAENEPLFRLGEELQAAAFRVHSYHHEIVGDRADLDTIQRDDLFGHYRAFYAPNNAVLTAAGDFDTDDMLAKINTHFGETPARPAPPRRARPEPPQTGERRVNVEGPGETGYVQLAYRSPQGAHPDFFPLSVLDSLLTGPTSLNLFGSGVSNKTSRLYNALVERDLAVGVSGGLVATIDPYLYTITITVHPESTAEHNLSAVAQEIDRLQQAPPPAAEVARAVKQARALFAYGSESITNQGYWLGFAEMFNTYDWFTGYLDRLAQVTPEEVQRVAQTYLAPQQCTVGVYLPTGNGAPDDE
jgi:zinc protease